MTRRSWFLLLLVVVALVAIWILLPEHARFDSPRDLDADRPAPARTEAGSSRPEGTTPAIIPRPMAESEPARTIEIEVVRTAGTPVPDVPVVVYRNEDVLLSARTDRAGLVRLAAPAGAARVAATPPGYRLIDEPVSSEEDRTRLVVPDGLEISGTVRVGGRAPPTTVGVALFAREEVAELSLPSSVRSRLDYRYAHAVWQTETAEDGGFRFLGLPPGFEGQITLELPYTTKRHESDKLRAPAKDIVVEAIRYVQVSGRVVDVENGAPIGGANVSLSWKSATATATGSGQHVQDDGRFKITVQADGVTAITVEAKAGGGNKPTQIEITDRLDEDHDVGDVAVDRGRLVRLSVRNEAGKPIAGARAAPPRSTRSDCCEPTDADGRTTLHLTREATTIKVGALGYGVTEAPVPAELTGVVEVTLPSSTLLIVRIVAAGAPVPGMMVKIKTSRQFLPVNSIAIGGKDEPLMAAGMSGPMPFGIGSGTYSFDAGAEGIVRLSDMPTGKVIGIQVTDSSGAPQLSEEVTLAPGERREVVATITEKPRTLAGSVTDPAGKPIAAAVVVVAHDSKDLEDSDSRFRWLGTAKTDATGRFSLKNLYVRQTNVGVFKSGYASVIRPDVPIPADGGETKFVLAPATPVRVQILDSSGAPVAVFDVTGLMDGSPIAMPEWEGPGTYVFTDCGSGVLEVRVKYANGTWSTKIDTTREHEGRITVPVLSHARVTWAKELDDGAQQLLVNLTPTDSALGNLGRYTKPGEKEIRFEAVAPGSYTASIEVDPRTLNDKTKRKPLAETKVDIVEGQTAEVVFKRP